MDNSWQKFLYYEHDAFALSPLTSENSVRLLDVLLKDRKGSKPILGNVGSMADCASKESDEEVMMRLREGLKRFEEGQKDDEGLFKLDRTQLNIKHTVKSSASVKSSLRIFGAIADFNVYGDKHLECNLEGVQIASVDRRELDLIISRGTWKPDAEKFKKLGHWCEKRKCSVFNCFHDSDPAYDLWVVCDILKAKKMVFASVGSNSGAVGANITASVAPGSPPMGAKLGRSATKEIVREFTVGNDTESRAFALRAIHARYNSRGERDLPVRNRGSSIIQAHSWNFEHDGINPRMVWAGLSLKSPGDNQDENGEDLECLEIVPAHSWNFEHDDINPRRVWAGLSLKSPGDKQDENGEDLECLEIVPAHSWNFEHDDINPRLDLAGLFLKSPGDRQDENGEDLECLEIVPSNLAAEMDT